RNQRAHGRIVAIARSRKTRRGTVEAGNHVNIVAIRRQGSKARREFKISASLTRNPVFLGDAVTVEPEHETRGDGALSALSGCGVSSAVAVEHGGERRQPDAPHRACEPAAKKQSPR